MANINSDVIEAVERVLRGLKDGSLDATSYDFRAQEGERATPEGTDYAPTGNYTLTLKYNSPMQIDSFRGWVTRSV